MTNAWTPGPWVYDPNAKIVWHSPDNRPSTFVCIVQHVHSKANAHLISAAPMGADLAECVLQNANDCPKAVVDLAVAFLAKAGGE